MADVDCGDLTTRQINLAIRELTDSGERQIHVLNPWARHNLAVALSKPVHLSFDGSVGYFCGAMIDGPSFGVHGNAGWSVGENMMSGEIVVEGNAGNSAGASIRGGSLIVKGNAGARAGISMKGGLVIIQGNSGYMTGFMMQKGVIVVCGDVGEGVGDSMYEGTIFVGGKIGDLGSDADIAQLTPADKDFLGSSLARYGIENGYEFKKIVAGRRLWHFSKKEIGIWIKAL